MVKNKTTNLLNLSDDEIVDELGLGHDKTQSVQFRDNILREGVRRVLLNQSSSESSGSAKVDDNLLKDLMTEVKALQDKVDELTRVIDTVTG